MIRKYFDAFGKLHRDWDEPAVKSQDGSLKEYYQHGILHRDHTKPARITKDLPFGETRKEYYQHGILHRDYDEPAIVQTSKCIIANKCKAWYKHGVLHRANDKPAKIYTDMDAQIVYEYWVENKLHRENDKPAKISKTLHFQEAYTKEWWYNNKQHRGNDKPAVIKVDPSEDRKEYEWYIHGKNKRKYVKSPKLCIGSNKQEYFERIWQKSDGPAKFLNIWNQCTSMKERQ